MGKPKKIKLVISDVHLGEGQLPGRYNPWHNFLNDDRLAEFFEYYSSGVYGDGCEVEMIIAGDFVDFLQIRYQDQFPIAVTEEIAVAKLASCVRGHPKVWQALHRFITKPGKTLTVLPGNHDLDFIFPAVRDYFVEIAAGKALAHKVKFCLNYGYRFDDILVQHGHEYESTNYFENKETLFIGPGGEPILDLPWGSYYHIMVLNPLKAERPYIDRVFPLRLYILGALFLDTRFALKAIWKSFKCLYLTRLTNFLGRRPSLASTLKIMIESIAIFDSLERHAKKISKAHPEIGKIIFGHSHGPMVRRFPNGALYYNSGTWTHSISLSLSSLGTQERITYILIDYPPDRPTPAAHLMVWHGFYNITSELLF